MTVFGTRPQYIKLSVLWRQLDSRFRSILIDSGQHYDPEMSGSFHQETGLRLPDYHLGIGSAPPGAQIGRIADALDRRLAQLSPHAVIVIGDTNTTAGAAVAAAYRGIPLAHVEAGLRSFDRSAPEEKNRILADHLATWRFCPTQTAVDNLAGEGIRDGVVGVGDILYEDWLRWRSVRGSGVGISGRTTTESYCFVTCHRAENVDDSRRLRRLASLLNGIGRTTIFAVHPRARRNLDRLRLWTSLKRAKRIRTLPPQPHQATLNLIGHADAVLTDSGGVQREAYWCRTPCLVLRDRTEWVELLSCGAGITIDLDLPKARRALRRRWRIGRAADRYFGIRQPSQRIIERLEKDLS